jgi:CelD/BcsL family acetyltransferase involved in cellulose biosynthesis
MRKLEARATVRFEIARTRQSAKAVLRGLHPNEAATLCRYCRDRHFRGNRVPAVLRRCDPAARRRRHRPIERPFADDKIIAANWGIASGDRYYDLVPNYDSSQWRAYAPGRLLTEWLLRHHLERGIFDYGIGDEPYKFDYCNLHTGLLDAHIPASAKGAAYNRILQLHQSARSKIRDTLSARR